MPIIISREGNRMVRTATKHWIDHVNFVYPFWKSVSKHATTKKPPIATGVANPAQSHSDTLPPCLTSSFASANVRIPQYAWNSQAETRTGAISEMMVGVRPNIVKAIYQAVTGLLLLKSSQPTRLLSQPTILTLSRATSLEAKQ